MFAQFVEDLSSTSSIFFGYNKIRKALGLGNVVVTNDLSIENVMLVKFVPQYPIHYSTLCGCHNCMFTLVDVTVL